MKELTLGAIIAAAVTVFYFAVTPLARIILEETLYLVFAK
jgi:hypothetical protein